MGPPGGGISDAEGIAWALPYTPPKSPPFGNPINTDAMKTGINFVRCNCSSAEAHNRRDKAYLEALERSGKKTYDIFHDRTATNMHWTNPAYAGRSLEQILQDCRERYTASTGQAPQEQDRVRKVKDKKTGLYKEVTTAGWSPIREGVCPVKEDTRLSDFNPLIKHLAAKGVRVISIDIHRDEGYQDPVTGERKYNYHAHVIADWTDRVTGKTAKLNKADMSEVQTVLADALGMERGESKEVTGKEHLTPEQQREKAAAEHAAQLEARCEDLEKQMKQDALIHEGELRAICKDFQSIGRNTVRYFDYLQGFGIEQLKPTPKEQNTRDQLAEECQRDLEQMRVQELQQQQSVLRVLIANTQNAIRRIGNRLQKLATGVKFWKKPRLAHEAELQAAVTAANAERDRTRAEAQKAVKSAENAQSAAESAKANANQLARQHQEALRTLDADKEKAREEGRKAGATAKDKEWQQWYNETGKPAIEERDQLRDEKAKWEKERKGWLQDFKDIARTLTTRYDADAVKDFEKAGLRDMVGSNLWDEAKKPEKTQSKGYTPHL